LRSNALDDDAGISFREFILNALCLQVLKEFGRLGVVEVKWIVPSAPLDVLLEMSCRSPSIVMSNFAFFHVFDYLGHISALSGPANIESSV
jgi:hypothetical protein